MDRDEAHALADLASEQMGLAARCEQVDAAAWAVVVGEGSQERRILEPAEYRAWRAETLGDPSQDAGVSSRTLLWRSLGWALSGLVGLLTQAISALSFSQRSELDVLEREREREMLGSYDLDHYGYRRTHPPDQR